MGPSIEGRTESGASGPEQMRSKMQKQKLKREAETKTGYAPKSLTQLTL